MTEKELIKKAQNGDKQAFCQLYSTYKSRLYRYAFYRLSNEDDSADAVSDTFVSAYEEIKQLKKAEAFPRWIFSILRAKCNYYIKQQINMKEAQSLDSLDNSTSLSENFSNVTIELKEALAQLKDDEKEIVLLSVVAGLSSKEIARVTDLTSGSVRSKLSRSLAKMRDYLDTEVKV